MALFSKNSPNAQAEMGFMDHLEALRWHLVRSVVVVISLAVVVFCFPDFVFGKIIFGPMRTDFITYIQLCRLSDKLGGIEGLCVNKINFSLISNQLSGQFTNHMWISFLGGLILGMPYVLYEIWRFVKPALKNSETKPVRGFVWTGTLLFMIGVLFAYFIIVPLSVQFLGNYSITSDNFITTLPTIDDYISLVSTLVLATGIVFEMPILVYFLTRLGIFTPAFMRKFRKHAVVVLLIVAAVITPSPDITSQMLVFVPIYLLYEISIFVSRYVENKYRKF
ncbi:MAG: Sec-independent protein translocase, TatC subunit [Bacteroidetes bacterium]|jgi:sec-independent protein translocase protein TatC|nr:Sec-independent protein translocase, TatC subunit [Bacteroidota bacterium]